MDPQNATALTNMGSCYRGGFGVEQDHCKAVEYYERAVECNAKDALWYLAEYLYNGVGIEQNFTRAMELYVRAAELGDADAQVKLGNIYRDGEIVEVNHEEANKWFMLAMEQGNSDALYAMAEAYYNGFGVEKDVPKSTELWKKSAELGHWGAQYITGMNYEEGDGIEKNFDEAVKWYTLAAEQKHPVACYRLAEIYRLGENGVTQDYEKALRYYDDAYAEGNEEATFRLGVLYFNGECGLTQNKEKAFEIWLKGSEAGFGGCSKNVGLCYKDGNGTSQNFPLAIEYFEKAMDQGNIESILELGYAYDKDGIAATDLEKAANYYAEAYAAGNPDGAFRLGLMYENGTGVEKDLAKALELYTYASDNGHVRATVKVGIFVHDGLAIEKNVAKSLEYFEKAKAMGATDADDMLAFVYKRNTAEDGIDPKKAFEFNIKRAEEDDAEAQFLVYRAYDEGIGVEENEAIANEWLRKAADNGYVTAQAFMGLKEIMKGNSSVGVEYWEKASAGGSLKVMKDLAELYRDGSMGVPMNKARALELFKKAADSGYAEAMCSLGVCYAIGDGVAQDDCEAFRWFKLAAEKGDQFAQNNLGVSYRCGQGTAENKALAVTWFEKAAEQGNIQAKVCLAEMYAKGEGVQIDYNKAESYYRDVIDAGESDYYDNAVFGLALMYSTIVNDNYKAFPLWKLSAEHGNTTAKYNLGICYHNGWGTLKDDNQALYWWRQAGAEGDENANDNVRVLEQEMQNGNSHNNAEHHDTAQKKSIGCYVATAVYGSYDCPEVWTLRRFRDNILAETWYGRAFIKIYYAISPTIVKWFGHAKWFNHMWRGALDRMVDKLQSNGVESTPYEDENSKI